MANTLMLWHEKILLCKKSVIKTIFDYLKNKLQLERTRLRSPVNFLVHILATLIT
nr:transposase [Candidatus Paracaedibacter acanthamoebae]